MRHELCQVAIDFDVPDSGSTGKPGGEGADGPMDEVQFKVLSVLKLNKPTMRHSSLISNVVVKLVRSNTIQRAPHVGYLHSAIAKATNEILIDLWRKQDRRRAKNGAVAAANSKRFRRFDETQWDVIELNAALELLADIDPRRAMVVTFRCFFRISMEEIAEMLEVSKSTVEADWRIARVWLYERLKKV